MFLLFIVYSNAIDEEMVELMQENAPGYTKFNGVQGEGSKEPHLGNHIWPSINNCIMSAVDKDQKTVIAEAVKDLKEKFPDIGASLFAVPLKEIV
jgi:hypothetical protein